MVALIALGGCAEAGKPKVSGTVTLNGNPVEQGEIRLLRVDGSGPTTAAVIVAGHYEIEASAGTYRVEIQGYQQTGTQPSDSGIPGSKVVPIMKPLLPDKYNVASELTLDVSGATEKNFDLTTP